MKALLLSLAMLLTTSAGAVDVSPALDDPTRPPAGVVGPDGSASASGSVGLTSVMLPKKGKATAVIDGQVVEIGGRVRDARLVRVSETSAVLEGPDGTERLYLTPDVEKKMIVTKGAVKRQKDKP
jgi:MSHA biogenesis protein MshK